MRFRLVETMGLHWGDLSKGIKAEQRKIGLHGTGHFGTGFYLVNKENYVDEQGRLKKDYDERRPIYEVNLDSYNLFKPRNNEDGYKFHDALRNVNRWYSKESANLLNRNTEREKERELDDWGYAVEQLYNRTPHSEKKEIELPDIDWENMSMDEILAMLPDEDLVDDEEEQTQDDTDYEKELMKLAEKFIKEHSLEPFMYYDWKHSGKHVEEDVNDAIEEKWDSVNYLKYAIDDLSQMFGVGKDIIVRTLLRIDKGREDTNSTQLMKALGYDGVDVTHLGKEGQGMSGLDNFTYGTVIYDLKPGTYKKIADSTGQSRKGESI